MTSNGINRLLLVTNVLPTEKSPGRGSFVVALAQQLARDGLEVDFIAPRAQHHPRIVRELLPSGAVVSEPRYLSASAISIGRRLTSERIATHTYAAGVMRAYSRMSRKPDVALGYFAVPAGYACASLARRHGLPAFVSAGESSNAACMRQFSRSAAREWGLHLSGAIALSAKNFRFVERYLGLPEADVLLLPNATDTEIFSPGGRDEARLRLGVRQDAKLVLFVGHLIERKGPLRLLSALATSEEQVVAAFLGSGPQVPRDVNVCFVGEVSRDVVVDWMRAADVFCLPTLAEGSPNVVIEALACGLPVVTTDLTGVQHLRHLEAVRLVCARASAKELMHAIDDMLVLSANAAVRKAARAYAEQHSLKVRSRRILQFMSSRIKSAEGTSSLHQAAAAREPILGPAQ